MVGPAVTLPIVNAALLTTVIAPTDDAEAISDSEFVVLLRVVYPGPIKIKPYGVPLLPGSVMAPVTF